MTWRLVFTARAGRDIAALDGATKERVGRALRRLAIDPVANSKRLSQPTLGTFRFRIGDYGVVFDIAGKDVVVLCVGHRSSIYR